MSFALFPLSIRPKRPDQLQVLVMPHRILGRPGPSDELANPHFIPHRFLFYESNP